MPRMKDGGFLLDDSGLAPYKTLTEKDIKKATPKKPKRKNTQNKKSSGTKKKK